MNQKKNTPGIIVYIALIILVITIVGGGIWWLSKVYFARPKESIENRIAYGVDLWETSSVNFLSENKLTDILVKTERFEIQALDENVDEDSYDEGNIGHKKFNLKAGDLICGNGNVEFYIGNNKYVGWGVVHKTYYLIKNYQ